MQSITREGKIGVAVRERPVAPRLLFIAGFLSFCGAGQAADSASSAASSTAGEVTARVGVACSIGAPFWAPPATTAEDLPWRSVWFGHFSGGRPYAGATGQTLVEWHDDKLCFASRQNCQAWIASQRRAYRRPEGFWTCVLLR
jgi:hypothetical protein